MSSRQHQNYTNSQPMPLREHGNGITSRYVAGGYRHEIFLNGNLIGCAFTSMNGWTVRLTGKEAERFPSMDAAMAFAGK